MLILVCEDDAAIRLLYRTALHGEAVDLVEVEGVQECLAQVAAQAPDVIVLDGILRDGTALDVLPALRAMCPQTRILVVSAQGGPELEAASIAAGADAYIDKLDLVPRIAEVLLRTQPVAS